MEKLRVLEQSAMAADVTVDAESTATELICATTIIEPNGEAVTFRLVITEDESGFLHVREHSAARLLPAACPERHVNRDGTFCIEWRVDADTFECQEDAEAWWQKLRGYLWEQLYARTMQQWPPGKSRAHGSAAQWEARFEAVAATEPAAVVAAARSGRWPPGKFTGLLRFGRRRPCPCGSGRLVKNCGHEKALFQLGSLLAQQARAEAAFYREWEGHPCCRADRNCPLRKNVVAPADRR